MDELLAPIGQLGAAMAALEVTDAAAEKALQEVLAGTDATDDDAAQRRAERDAKSAARGRALEATRDAKMAVALDARAPADDAAGRRAVLRYYDRAVFGFAASSAASLAGIVADGPLKQLKLQIDRHHDRLHALLLDLAPDGRVSRRTFCRALRQLELDASEATIEALFAQLDATGSGYIEYAGSKSLSAAMSNLKPLHYEFGRPLQSVAGTQTEMGGSALGLLETRRCRTYTAWMACSKRR